MLLISVPETEENWNPYVLFSNAVLSTDPIYIQSLDKKFEVVTENYIKISHLKFSNKYPKL